MSKPKTLIVGNWKMNGLRKDLGKISQIADKIDAIAFHGDVVICPPATLVALAADLMTDRMVKIGGQDCHAEECGAYTGDISAVKWKDAGAKYVIVGHSERRGAYREDSHIINAKAKAVIKAGLVPIICVGETKEEREAGKTLDVLSHEIRDCLPDEAKSAPVVIGYEPVWAIGTGVTPTCDEIKQAHTLIREALFEKIGSNAKDTPIIYGGSMKPENAKQILALPHIDGGLIGGASLQVDEFMAIISSSVV